jgi:putative ABC transport system permease protein
LALGIKPGRLGRLVMLETLVMSGLGLAIGVGGGAALALYLSHAGFAYPGMEEMGAKFNMPARLFPAFTLLALFWGPSVVFLGGMLATLYPALKLLRLQPVAAMRAV